MYYYIEMVRDCLCNKILTPKIWFYTYLGLPLLHALRDCSPDIAFVFSKSLFSLGLGQCANGILFGLMTDIGGQSDHGLHHVVPILFQPSNWIGIATMVQSNLNVFRCKTILFSLLHIYGGQQVSRVVKIIFKCSQQKKKTGK